MRLLQIHESGSFSLIERFGDDIPPYAILSHTWGSSDEEVSFQDLQTGTGEHKPGYRKILFCGKQAANDGSSFFWVDTCCIDKTSSAELSEAINSMYMWYGAAEVCYAYLADVDSIGNLPNSRWFTRGWTLQELIAPTEVVFYNEEWERLGTRLELSKSIQDCTGIPERVFLESTSLDSFSVAQKMSWAANRNTTRVEDRAYSLIGIFGINMPLIYGEGENAFIRLQEEVMKISDDHSLFAWTSQDGRGGCLATSPFSFRACANIVQTDHLDTFYDPPVVSSRGVQIELRFMGCRPGWRGLAILNCCEEGSADKPFAIYVQDLSRLMKRFERFHGDALTIPVRTIDPSLYSVRKLHIRTGRPDGKKVDQRTFDSLPPQAMDWQSRSEPRDSLETPHWDTIAPSLESVFHALYSAKEDEVWLLLTRPGVRINMQDHNGRTALSHAASKGYMGALRMLLAQRDIEVNLADEDGQTPLMRAAVARDTATVTLLLDDLRTDINTKDSSGLTPLMNAAVNGHDDIVRLLLRAGSAQVNVEGDSGRSPLWRSLYPKRIYESNELLVRSRSRISTIRLLLEFGANTEQEHDGNSMLVMEAGHLLDEEVALLLIEHGANVNARNWHNQAPLHLASRAGNLRTVQALLDKGADVQTCDFSSRTPLHEAIENGKPDVVSLLLERGTDIQARAKDEATPLHTASRCGEADVVSVLLERGADIQARAKDEATPLHTAAWEGNADVACLLLERGADVKAKDRLGRTALNGAISAKHGELVQKLIDYGADVNDRMEGGFTPLVYARYRGNSRIMQLLKANGARDEEEEEDEEESESRAKPSLRSYLRRWTKNH
jgi:ankyrin repeat protein